MNHLFVPDKISIALKDKGFNEPCMGFHNEHGGITYVLGITNYGREHITAPLYQQVVDWFREKEVKIIESKHGGWNTYTKVDNHYHVDREFYMIDEAITHALTLI